MTQRVEEFETMQEEEGVRADGNDVLEKALDSCHGTMDQWKASLMH